MSYYLFACYQFSLPIVSCGINAKILMVCAMYIHYVTQNVFFINIFVCVIELVYLI